MRASFKESLATQRANKQSRMLDRSRENRLEPECWPELKPSFRIEPGAKVFTVGSCFARNIERHLATHGFRLPTLEMSIPHVGELDGVVNAVLSKFTPPTMLQEFRWAHDILNRDDQVRDEDVMPLLLRVGDEKAIDLQLIDYNAIPLAHAIERRKAVYRIFREAFTSDVIVLTFGLVEAWKDLETDLYIVRAPLPQMDRTLMRFQFERLGFVACYEAAKKTIELLLQSGPKKFILTTSPVTLGVTFTKDDVIVANNYAKSVLTAVSGQLSYEYKDVDYLPTYESVVLTRQSYVWDDDLKHVSPAFIGRIISRFWQAYGPEGHQAAVHRQAEHRLKLVSFADKGMWTEAEIEFRKLEGALQFVPDGAFQLACAGVLLRSGDKEGARKHLKALTTLELPDGTAASAALDIASDLGDPQTMADFKAYLMKISESDPKKILRMIPQFMKRGLKSEAYDVVARATKFHPHVGRFWRILGRVAAEVGKMDVAVEALNKSIELDGNDAKACFSLGDVLIDLGRSAEAVASLEKAVKLDGGNAHYWLRLARAQEAAGDLAAAERSLRRSVELDPAAKLFQNQLASFLERAAGRPGEAAAPRVRKPVKPLGPLPLLTGR